MIKNYKLDVKNQGVLTEKQLLEQEIQKYYNYYANLPQEKINKIDELIKSGLCDKNSHIIVFDTLSEQGFTKDLWKCSKRYQNQSDEFKIKVGEVAYKNANNFLIFVSELVALKDEEKLLQFAKTFPNSCLMPKILTSFLLVEQQKGKRTDFSRKEFSPYINFFERIEYSNFKNIDDLPYYTTDMKLDYFNYRNGFVESDLLFAREFKEYVQNITKKSINLAKIYRCDEKDNVKSVDYIYENLQILDVLKATGYNDKYYKKFFSNPENDNLSALRVLFNFPEILDSNDYELILRHIDFNLRKINATKTKYKTEQSKIENIIANYQNAATKEEEDRVRLANLKEYCSTPSKTKQLTLNDF